MPIIDQGYQHWSGSLDGHAWRWLAITRRGVDAQWKNKAVRGVVLLSLIPGLLLATVLALWGLFEQKSSLLTPFLSLLQDLPDEVKAGPKAFRVTAWTLAFHIYLGSQLLFAMLTTLLVGPDLISQDLRFNAIPLYFSRPLRRVDYFLGKLGVIGAYLGVTTVVPTVLAYVLGLAFSLDPRVVVDTWRVLVGGVGFGLVVILSAGPLMLAASALSRNARYVGAIWMGIWVVSNVTAGALERTVRADWCPIVSYTGNLLRVREALLDTPAARARVIDLIEAGRRAATESANPFRFGRRGRRAAPPPAPAERPGRPENISLLPDVSGYPWTWSAGVLLGLLGLSSWTLAARIRSLDRLR